MFNDPRTRLRKLITGTYAMVRDAVIGPKVYSATIERTAVREFTITITDEAREVVSVSTSVSLREAKALLRGQLTDLEVKIPVSQPADRPIDPPIPPVDPTLTSVAYSVTSPSVDGIYSAGSFVPMTALVTDENGDPITNTEFVLEIVGGNFSGDPSDNEQIQITSNSSGILTFSTYPTKATTRGGSVENDNIRFILTLADVSLDDLKVIRVRAQYSSESVYSFSDAEGTAGNDLGVTIRIADQFLNAALNYTYDSENDVYDGSAQTDALTLVASDGVVFASSGTDTLITTATKPAGGGPTQTRAIVNVFSAVPVEFTITVTNAVSGITDVSDTMKFVEP